MIFRQLKKCDITAYLQAFRAFRHWKISQKQTCAKIALLQKSCKKVAKVLEKVLDDI
jgi:hypothetical protein